MNFEMIKEMPVPNMDNPLILAPIILMLVGIFLPLIIWFIRNVLRIIFNKNIEWLNRSLKWFFLFGGIIFIISIILLALVASGVIK